MYKHIRLFMSLALMLNILGCTKSEKILKPYFTTEDIHYSVLILAKKDDFFDRTIELNEITKEHPTQIIKAGVITNDSKQGKYLIEHLNIDKLPAYILMDNKDVRFVSNDFEDYQQKIIELIGEKNAKKL